MLPIYKDIIEAAKDNHPTKEDYEIMNAARARIAEWITVEDVGVVIARDNGIPLKIIEAYAFPPEVRY